MKPALSKAGFLFNEPPTRMNAGQTFNQQVLP